MRTWYIWIPLWLGYLVLSGNFEWLNIAAGFVIALGLTALIRPRMRKLQLRRFPGAAWALGRYIFLLAYDMVTSGLQVARIVLDPALPIVPGIIAIPTKTQSELAVALSAHSITISPGEMVIEIDDEGVMYTHVLDANRSDDYIIEAQQTRENLLRKIIA
ncbi:MAG: Na+/H+ antiporter subunit E [Anaerolineales bacterium]|nr:Na+/H+ antiporter subunit E [Anaerolineales bacterium]